MDTVEEDWATVSAARDRKESVVEIIMLDVVVRGFTIEGR